MLPRRILRRTLIMAALVAVLSPVLVAPTVGGAPSDISLLATAVGQTAVELAWVPPGVGVATYQVRRDGQPLAAVAAATLRLDDAGLRPATWYTYSVEALDAAGAVVAQSRAARVKTPAPPETPDTTPPSTPEGLTATPRASTIVLDWYSASDDTDVLAYRVRRDGMLLVTVNAGTLQLTDANTRAGVAYTYTVEALDVLGQVSPPSVAVTAVSPLPSPTVTFAPIADAHVEEANPDTNYGATSELNTDGGPHRQSYLAFAVRGMVGTVQGAKLRLYVINGSANAPAVQRTRTCWEEYELTWSKRPPLEAGTPYDDKGRVSSGTWVEYDVSALVVGDGDYSFVLIPQTTDGFVVSSRESPTAADRPQLVVAFSLKR